MTHVKSHAKFYIGSIYLTTDVNRIRKNIHYTRWSIILKSPKHLEDLHLSLTNLVEIKTNKDEIFLLINNTEKNIVAFSTTNLKFLSEYTTLLSMAHLKNVLNFLSIIYYSWC